MQIEGRNPVIEAIKSNRPIDKIIIKKGQHRGVILDIINIAKKSNIPIKEIEDSKFYKITKSRGHQGVIAIASSRGYVTVDQILEFAKSKCEDPLVVVLNELKDPQNLGSIIRTAECLGAHGVIIPKHRACQITPTVIKASVGAIEYMYISRVTNIADTLEYLKEKGLWVMGADAEGKDYFTVDLTGPIALVIGGEDKGLGKRVKQTCDALLRIPMRGKINSLNAAMAMSILGYDILRQRIMKK